VKRKFGLVVVAAALVLAVPGMGAGKKEKDKPQPAGQVVDSGSFGVFVSGKRVATEKFQVEKREDGNVSNSELTVDDGNQKYSQTSQLQLATNGDLQRYSWKEQSPGKGETTVEPKDTFLMEYVSPKPEEKTQEVPFFTPRSTAILDDNFFIHRELLVWRYMGAGCQLGLGQTNCRPPKMTFGVIVPRQAVFITVSLEYLGREKVTVGGAERELSRFNLSGESISWALWLDDQHKLVRILIPADNTEVVRD
jgi:hypothetical protein